MRRKFLTIATIAMMTAATSVPAFANTRVSNLKVIDLDTYNFDGPTVGNDENNDAEKIEQTSTEEAVLCDTDADSYIDMPVMQDVNVLPQNEAVNMEQSTTYEAVQTDTTVNSSIEKTASQKEIAAVPMIPGFDVEMTAMDAPAVEPSEDSNVIENTQAETTANDATDNTASAETVVNDATENAAETETSFPESESIPNIFAALNIDTEKTEKAIMAIASAFEKLGMPYSQAKRDSGRAYDCSSMVYYSYRSAGIDLGYEGSTTAASICKGLVAKGKEITLNDLKAGDLLFYSKKKNNGRFRKINHVAMYIGNGQIIHASSSKGKVVQSNLYTSGLASVCRPSL